MSAKVETSTTPVTQDTEAIGRRVFVANLTFQTRESELKTFCEQVGPVSECKIIFRGPRSLGYGFVTFEKEEHATKAVETLKEKELDERLIKIELATPRSERSSEDAPPRSSFRGRGRGRGSRGRGGRNTRRSHENDAKSTTTIFVGNLPFNAVDEDLFNIFKAYSPSKCYVVRRYDGGSRGFGFAVFDEAQQKEVLEKIGTVVCDDRTLIIRAAYEDPAKAENEEAQAQE